MEKRTPEQSVEYAKRCWKELHDLTQSLFETTPELQQDEKFHVPIENFQRAMEQLSNGLEKPTFKIATVGTTSSGKSTAVNALIGRSLAPIEKAEMSAGTLTFIHCQDGEGGRLTIEKTPGSEELWNYAFPNPAEAKWKLGTETNLSDSQIYNKLRASKKEYDYDGVMAAYHHLKNQRPGLIAPSVRVEVPLMPMLCPELLQLPTGTHFELIDLPGLKSIGDTGNLAVIQEQVKQAFSLVILDYNQTNEKTRDELLEQLKDIVTALGGRTDRMLFVLNKVDSRTTKDNNLDSEVSNLGNEIAKKLELDEPPEIVKTSLLVLYYAQCAWGPSALKPLVGEGRQELISALTEDCAKLIKQSKNTDLAFKKWYAKHEDDCTEGKFSDDNFRYLLTWAKQVSGGQTLWDRLRQRVAERFAELVIFPLVNPVVEKGELLITEVLAEAGSRKIVTVKEANKRKEQLDKQFADARETLAEEVVKFSGKLKKALDTLAKGNTKENVEEAQKELGQPKGLSILGQIRQIVRGDVQEHLIQPMRDALEKGTKPYDFVEKVRDYVIPSLRPELQEIYRKLTQFLTSQDVGGKIIWDWGGWINVKNPPDDVREASRQMMLTMCQAITLRAEWTLQVQLTKLQEGLNSILEKQKEGLIEIALKGMKDKDANTLKAELSSLALSQSVKLQLPEPFMECPTGYVERTFLGIPYWFDKLLSSKEMAIELLKKVDLANSEKLWPVITTYLTTEFDKLTENLKTALEKAKSFLDQGLSEQIKRLEEGKESDLQKWGNVDKQCESIKEAFAVLEQAARSTDQNGGT